MLHLLFARCVQNWAFKWWMAWEFNCFRWRLTRSTMTGVPWSSSVLELESGKIHFPQGVLRCFDEKDSNLSAQKSWSLFSSTPLFQQVWGTSLLKWGKPRNESIIAALTGQQSPDNDKEDFWCCRWFFLPSQCGGDDDDANDVNDMMSRWKRVSSPSFLRSGSLTNSQGI